VPGLARAGRVVLNVDGGADLDGVVAPADATKELSKLHAENGRLLRCQKLTLRCEVTRGPGLPCVPAHSGADAALSLRCR
jgi:hypothetical protein